MNRHSIRNFSIAGTAAAGAFAILGGTLVHAQSAPATPPAAGATSSTVAAAALEAPPGLPDPAAYVQSLASNLGVTADALTAAVSKTNLDTIASLEASGKLTSQQADQLRQQAQADAAAGAVHFGIGPVGVKSVAIAFGGADQAALSGFFGITEDQLRAEQANGGSLATVAAAHGKSRDQLKAFLTSEIQRHLAQDVGAGRLTQAQADAMLAKFTANLDVLIDSKGFVRGTFVTGPGPGGVVTTIDGSGVVIGGLPPMPLMPLGGTP